MRPMIRRLLTGAAAALAAAGACFGLFQLLTWPEVAELAEENPETTAFIERTRKRARSQGHEAPVDRRWVPYERISPHLKVAVVAAEDIGFFSHEGFAVDEIKAAVRDRIEEGKKLRGASTISQQLVKNLWLSPSRNPWRKVKEALLTVQLERHLDKRRILEIYLNSVEFAPGVYGAEAAARRFYGRSAAELTTRQAAALAAGLPRPSSWHPGSESAAYQRRVERIHGRMGQAAWLYKVV